MKLDNKFISFLVISGNQSLPNNSESIRHASSDNYSFDEVDCFLIKHLKKPRHLLKKS